MLTISTFDLHRSTAAGQEAFLKSALDALNSDVAYSAKTFVKLLNLLPDDWHCAALTKFLINGLTTLHHHRMQTNLERALLRFENRQVNLRHLEVRSAKLFVSRQVQCDMCKTNFTDADYVWLPVEQAIVHRTCASRQCVQ